MTTVSAKGIEEREAMVSDGLLTVEEARRFLSVSRSTIYELMDTGALPYVRFGRMRRVPRRALVEFSTKGLVGG
jgi:excisionase family DNA binding protein